jgi:hypothetical protein
LPADPPLPADPILPPDPLVPPAPGDPSSSEPQASGSAARPRTKAIAKVLLPMMSRSVQGVFEADKIVPSPLANEEGSCNQRNAHLRFGFECDALEFKAKTVRRARRAKHATVSSLEKHREKCSDGLCAHVSILGFGCSACCTLAQVALPSCASRGRVVHLPPLTSPRFTHHRGPLCGGVGKCTSPSNSRAICSTPRAARNGRWRAPCHLQVGGEAGRSARQLQ